MHESFLGLGGRLGRLRFFLQSLMLAALLTAITFAIVLSMMRSHLPGELPEAGSPATMAVCLILVLPIYLWFTLSLTAKRLRDIGWSPLYVIPAWLAVNLIDGVVAHLVPALAIAPRDGTMLGAIVNLLMIGALLFWPGRESDDEWIAPTVDSTYRHEERRVAVTVATSQPAVAGFGRRRP